jgi:hypothetical protein
MLIDVSLGKSLEGLTGDVDASLSALGAAKG